MQRKAQNRALSVADTCAVRVRGDVICFKLFYRYKLDIKYESSCRFIQIQASLHKKNRVTPMVDGELISM